MDPRNDLTDNDLAYWLSADEVAKANIVTYLGNDDDVADCATVQTVLKDGRIVVRTAWQPNEIELMHLARGGTVWLSTWGGLPPHMLEISERHD